MTIEQINPVLFLDDVHVSYGSKAIIDGFSLSVSPGETYGLIGLNGAGKTTLIKTILGLRDQTSGLIKVEGRDRLDRESKKHISYLPERFDPPYFLTGIEFINFSLSLYKKVVLRAEIDGLSEELALDHMVLDNKVQTYSKGMRQKLGLLATLLTGCPFLILDEPMSGLDPRARVFVKKALSAAKAQGRAVFLSSHILSDMDEICDRVGLLHEGRLVYSGTPEALKKQEGEGSLERAFLKVIEPRQAA